MICYQRITETLTVGALLFLIGGAARAQETGDVIGLPIGARPEAVVIETLEGEPVDLSEILGSRPVLLQFWATWCENCKALRPEMEAAYREYGDRVAFLAVAVAVSQSKRSIRRHVEREPVRYPIAWDTRGRATRAFSAPTTSYLVILDATGAVTYTGVGPRQDVRGALGRLFDTSR